MSLPLPSLPHADFHLVQEHRVFFDAAGIRYFINVIDGKVLALPWLVS
jgi:hypothetical protein